MVTQPLPQIVCSSVDNAFHEEILLMPNLNLLWYNLKSFPLILLLVTWEKSSTPTWLHPFFR